MTYSSTPVTVKPPPVYKDEMADEEVVEETTATLPAGLFAGMAPRKGDTVTLRIVNVFDGEIEVAPQVEETESPEGSADAEIDAMDG